MSKLHALILKLASRPCGTNCRELVAQTDLSTQCASDALQWRVEKHGFTRVKGRATPEGHVSHQYFLHAEHAKAWEIQTPSKRPNVALKVVNNPRRSNTKVSIASWRRAPMTGDPKAPVLPKHTQVETRGLALGYDCRTQMAPEQERAFVGEFTTEWRRLRA